MEVPSVHLFGFGGINRYTHFDGAGDTTASLTANGDFAAYTPLRIALGTGMERAWGSAESTSRTTCRSAPAYDSHLDGRTLDVQNGVSTDRGASLDSSRRVREAPRTSAWAPAHHRAVSHGCSRASPPT